MPLKMPPEATSTSETNPKEEESKQDDNQAEGLPSVAALKDSLDEQPTATSNNAGSRIIEEPELDIPPLALKLVEV